MVGPYFTVSSRFPDIILSMWKSIKFGTSKQSRILIRGVSSWSFRSTRDDFDASPFLLRRD
ncbi:hypothetical protein LptCag_0238 [Leptospirillum ferriphilum]|uniref:Uncharacterized protein n=1 Tax=Leptospirillum ferriphilum TaxID=178606 RepID=A0A094WAW5_9BACT|nr:hypothetical protein LptCag_0238 [Leptospirillum ferriphilum]